MKKNSNKKVICYGLCGFLVAFYLVVLYLGMNPNVDFEYRMYYITNELTDWPGYEKLHYDLGTWEYCAHAYEIKWRYEGYGIANRKGHGWKYEKVMDEGVTNAENSANMYYVPKTSKDNATFNIKIIDYQGDNKTYVYAGDECIGEFNGVGTHSFTVPRVVENQVLEIRFETDGDQFTMYQVMLG